MTRAIVIIAGFICAGWLASCTPSAPLHGADREPRRHEIHVVSNGWHTAIVARRDALVATGFLPEAGDFPGSSFIEFGWGDRDYFRADEKTVGIALKAALAPTPAVMHLAGVDSPPEQRSEDVEVVSVALTRSGFRDMVVAIASDLKRPEGGRAQPISPGLVANSHFYDADGTFHLFNTCNTWTARKLRDGGVNLSPTGVITARQLTARLRDAVGSN